MMWNGIWVDVGGMAKCQVLNVGVLQKESRKRGHTLVGVSSNHLCHSSKSVSSEEDEKREVGSPCSVQEWCSTWQEYLLKKKASEKEGKKKTKSTSKSAPSSNSSFLKTSTALGALYPSEVLYVPPKGDPVAAMKFQIIHLETINHYP